MRLRKLSIHLLVTLILCGILSNFSATPVEATSAIGALPCAAYSLERVVSSTSFEKINCYNTFGEALNAMNASTTKNIVVRHESSKSPMKIMAMDRGIVVNVPDRASTSDQTTTLIYRYSNFNTTYRSYINTYNTMAYYGTATDATSYTIGIAGFKGYIKPGSADLVPMLFIENNWPISLGGNSSGNNVITNTIRPNYYQVSAGSPNEMNYYFSEINRSATSKTYTFTTDAYALNSNGWFTKIGGSSNNTIYRVNDVENIRVRTGPGTSYPTVSGGTLLQPGYTFVGTDVAVGQWVKISSYTTPSVLPAYQRSSTTYGAAPSWLQPGTRYYSYDGITFYSDIDMKNVVANGAQYYNYFQFLPARSYTTHTADQLNKYLVDRGYNSTAKSAMFNSGAHFITNQNTYFMNGLMVYALAIHESAYGTSTLALNRNNLFGWNAVDSDPGQATYFQSVEQAIREHMSLNLNGYLNLNDWRYAGTGLGQK
ncbi:MAG: glucosaminidase domain-containing protein, partial [Erysipelothrix sp.]|nr:glucosaminidase domain-containing protein [Erysipelothrix sp.]